MESRHRWLAVNMIDPFQNWQILSNCGLARATIVSSLVDGHRCNLLPAIGVAELKLLR